ncbi:MAG: tRNA threonylcarbamoyladenosine dehydratase [Bacteroidales bacterium]|nr:tRNA threonylcarbamoyladenosine dehydratase [Bacteroidales bacterium]
MDTRVEDIFSRTVRLVGDEAMSRIGSSRVIIFGVGGVGSWCAEGLVRSGIGHLTIVDGDLVCASNVNRQAMATTETIGRVKVDAMRERLLSINPNADIVARQELYTAESAESFRLEEYDFVIDAIDSLADKLELILHATAVARGGKCRFYSSMGAARKMDISSLRVTEFWDVDGCPLARALRKRMRRQQRYPSSKFKCVWSPEVKQNLCGDSDYNGTMVHVTAAFGFTLSGLVLHEIVSCT